MRIVAYLIIFIFCFNCAEGQEKLKVKKTGFLKLKKEYYLGETEIDKPTFYKTLKERPSSAKASKNSTILNYSSTGLLASAYIVQLLVVNQELDNALSSNDFTKYNTLSVLNGMMYNLSFYGFAQASHSRRKAIAIYNNDSLPKQRLFLTTSIGYPPYSFIEAEKPEKEFTTMNPAISLGVQYLINKRNYGYAKVYGFQEIDYDDGSVSYSARSNSYNIGFGSYFLRNSKVNVFVELGIGMTYLDTEINGFDLFYVNDQNKEVSGLLRIGLSSLVDRPWVFDASAGVGFFLPTFEFSIHRKLF